MLQAVILAGTMAWAIQACSAGTTPGTATAVTSSSGVSSTGTTGSTGSDGFGSTVVPRGGPPPEAVAACTGRSEGASCSFTAPSGELSGTCHSGRDGSGSLACMPAGHPGDGGPGKPPDGGQGPHGGPPPQAVAACAKLASGATCSFTAPFGNVTGTCRTGPNGGTLACSPAGGGPR
jgi:hypothetical protein